MRILRTGEQGWEEIRSRLIRPPLEEMAVDPKVAARTEAIFGEALTPLQAVDRILAAVRAQGDAALLDYSRRIDGMDLSVDELFVSQAEMEAALESLDPAVLAAIRQAGDNIRAFHERQQRNSWMMSAPGGVFLGQRLVPLTRIGAYVPGGTAPLMSTVLMSVIPARVAGVQEIILATPGGEGGRVDPHVLAAAATAGVDRVLRVGGAQAIAALAYGTATVPAVDKIVGPGNLFVALAKKQVFGRVGIESLAGPSEVLILADDSAPVEYVAADLVSQAEHDTAAAAWLVTPSEDLAAAVAAAVERHLTGLPREEVTRAALAAWGAIVVCRDLDEGLVVLNDLAAEHVQLMVEEPLAVLNSVRHAGAVFMGPWSPVPIGDFAAGPNHILPTNRTARFASPLGMDDFMKAMSVIGYTQAGLEQAGPAAMRIAGAEGLEGHVRSLELRLGAMGREPEEGSAGDE